MFGVTIAGCWLFRLTLTRLNKKLEQGELAGWDAREDVAQETAKMEGTTADEALNMRKGFRYLV